MKPQTPGRGFFYVLMMEETGNFSSGCPGLYTRIFRARTGSWSGAYTVYSIFQGPGRLLVPSVYRKLEKPGPWARTVYSDFPGPSRFVVWSVYSKLKEPGPRAESVYSNFPGPGRFLVNGVYRKLEKLSPGQNLYTQIFWAWAGSCSMAYTASSKSQGRTCILKFSGLWQVPG